METQVAGEIGARWNIVFALLWSVGGKRWAQPLMRIGTVRVMIGGINFGPNRVRANRRFLPASMWGLSAFSNIGVSWKMNLERLYFDS